MALRFLKSIVDGPFPMTINKPQDVATVKGLHALDCVNVTFSTDAFGVEIAVVQSVTSFGRTALKAVRENTGGADSSGLI